MTYRDIASAAIIIALASCTEMPKDVRQVDTLPEIWPDYTEVTIPKTIAPLNFAMADDEVTAVFATITGPDGKSITADGEEANFDIEEWRALLSGCGDGDSVMVSVAAKYPDGWKGYKPFAIYVSQDTLAAYGLTYRRIAPGYEVYSHMGIYERCLSSFEETVIMENTEIPNSCVNCHTSRRGSAEDYVFHVRGEGGGTVLSHGGQIKLLNTPTAKTIGATTYPAWHPDGRYVAFSVNTTRQSFHQTKEKRLEVFDVASDIVAYDIDENKIITSPLLNKTDSCWETFPCFSADGGALFYCSAKPRQVPSDVRESRYILSSVRFDASTGRFAAKSDTVLDLRDRGLSISLPRTSADGRFLMFTACDYGTFPIWHSEADLWLMDLRTGEARPVEELNSDEAESFHNWSPDSRWVVFSSRRGDGLFTRLYMAHISPEGRASKPFLLPQIDPKRYYREMMYSYNVPDFSTGRVENVGKQVGRIAKRGGKEQVGVE